MQVNPDYSEDKRIRQRVLVGDVGAAEAFFQRHMDALYEFVHYRVGGDRATSEDIVQDTLLVALERLRTWDGRSSLYTWMCGIARNKIRSHRRQRRPVSMEDLLADSDTEIDVLLADVEHESLPDWVLERQETQELVGATLSSLPPKYRDALVRKYVDDLSLREIALATQVGTKAAESTLFRAKQAFAKVFQLLAKRRGDLA